MLAALMLAWPAVSVLADRVTIEGRLTQGGMAIGTVPPGSQVRVDGEPVRVSEDGKFVVGFGRDAPRQARIDVAFPDGSVEHRTLEVSARDYDIQRIDGLSPSKVTPGEEALRRIQRENALIAEARRVDAARTDFTRPFIRPAPGPVSGVFGSQRILNGKPRRPHYGVDYAAPEGTPVKAPAPGVVTLVHEDMYYSGGTVILDHGHGISSVFIHLSRIDVAEGRRLARGEVLGAVGKTGRATGPHLHWGVNWFDKRLDPALLLR